MKKRKGKKGFKEDISQRRCRLKGYKVYLSHVCSKCTHSLLSRGKSNLKYAITQQEERRERGAGPQDVNLGVDKQTGGREEPSTRGGDGDDRGER